MPDMKLNNPTAGPVFADASGITLSILIYLDDTEVFSGEKFVPKLLKQVLVASGATVEILDRATTIDENLLNRFHEVWFLLAALNMDQALSDAEAAALRQWMDGGGGVLIAGDHARWTGSGLLEGLGRPIGRRVPRARHMRIWDAQPGADATDTRFDTTDNASDRRGSSDSLEQDVMPQRLLLPNFGVDPHIVFLDAAERLLDRLPDHSHEGMAALPDSLRSPTNAATPYIDEWMGGSVAPQIVARGIDWRRGVCSDVMAAWDGHRVRAKSDDQGKPQFCGRILADSSWHHYLDFNLAKIAEMGDGEWNDWAKIKALYVNQAAWLAPPAVKKLYSDRAYAWVSKHPDYTIRGAEDCRIGCNARRLLALKLPGAWLHELVDDLLAELDAARVADLMPEGFGDILLGAHMRHLMTEGRMEPVLHRVKPRHKGRLAEAIAGFEDGLALERERWEAFLSRL